MGQTRFQDDEPANSWCSSARTFFKQVYDEVKEGRVVGTHFRNEPDDHRILVSMMLACNQLFLRSEIGSRTRCQLRFKLPLSNRISRNHSVASSLQTTILCSELTFPNYEQSSRVVGDHLLLEERKAT